MENMERIGGIMSKTVLLTGATGFIGSHLLEELINQNYEVIILKRSFSNTWRIDHLLDNITFYDIDKVPIENIFDNHEINYVVHLATYYKKTHEYNDIEEMMESNITIPTKILEQMRLHSVEYFINTGTFFEYDLNSRLIGKNNNIWLLSISLILFVIAGFIKRGYKRGNTIVDSINNNTFETIKKEIVDIYPMFVSLITNKKYVEGIIKAYCMFISKLNAHKSLTPREICNRYGNIKGIETITEIFEKVYYGNKSPEKDDINKYDEFFKRSL